MDDAIKLTTKEFFKKYFYRLVAMSGRSNDELLPANIENFHPLDDCFPAKLRQADALVYCAGKAISECEDIKRKPYRTILVECYLNELLNREIYNKLNYSSSRYNVLKSRALSEFTNRFNYWVAKQGVKPLVQLINK